MLVQKALPGIQQYEVGPVDKTDVKAIAHPKVAIDDKTNGLISLVIPVRRNGVAQGKASMAGHVSIGGVIDAISNCESGNHDVIGKAIITGVYGFKITLTIDRNGNRNVRSSHKGKTSFQKFLVGIRIFKPDTLPYESKLADHLMAFRLQEQMIEIRQRQP